MVIERLHIAQWGVYANASVASPIRRSSTGDTAAGVVDAITTLVLERTPGAGATSTVEAGVPTPPATNAHSSSYSYSYTLESEVLDSSGKVVATATPATGVVGPAGMRHDVHQPISLAEVQLWSVASPTLFTLRTTLRTTAAAPEGRPRGNNEGEEGAAKGVGVKEEVLHTRFGFRDARFHPDKGFFLNGRPLKIKSTANHQGFAGVGVAVPDALQRFRVARLKAMGSNAWRTAHNPPNVALLDECDAQGMLVWD